MDCISFGSCGFDLLLTVDHAPASDERVAASSARAGGGGPAATASVALRRLGVSVGLVSAVGDDLFGQIVRDELAGEGIDLSGLQTLRGTTTTVASVVIDPSGARSMAVLGGCINSIAVDRIDWDNMPVVRAVLLDGNNPELATAAARWARARKIPVLLDGGNIAASHLFPLLPLCDVFVPDLQSARRQLGQGLAVSDMCRAFRAAGAATVCITLGDKGAIALQDGEFHEAPPPRGINIVDTTGAGDNFHGAFQYCRLRGWDLGRTLAFSNAFAALTCRGIGGRAAIPSLAETEAAMLRGHTSI